MRRELWRWVGIIGAGLLLAAVLLVVSWAAFRLALATGLLPRPEWWEVGSPVEGYRCFKRAQNVWCFEQTEADSDA